MGQPTPWPPGNELSGIITARRQTNEKQLWEKMAEQGKNSEFNHWLNCRFSPPAATYSLKHLIQKTKGVNTFK